MTPTRIVDASSPTAVVELTKVIARAGAHSCEFGYRPHPVFGDDIPAGAEATYFATAVWHSPRCATVEREVVDRDPRVGMVRALAAVCEALGATVQQTDLTIRVVGKVSAP